MHSSTLHAHSGNNGKHFRTNTLLTSAGGKGPWGRKQRYGQVRTCHRAYSNNSVCPNRSCGLISSSRLLLLPTVEFLYLSLRLRRSLSLCLSERTWVDANSRKPLYDWVVVMYDQRTLTTCTWKHFTGITLVAPQLPANGQCSWRWCCYCCCWSWGYPYPSQARYCSRFSATACGYSGGGCSWRNCTKPFV